MTLFYNEEIEIEEEFNELFGIASGLCYKHKKRRERCIDQLAEIGVKAVGPILYVFEYDAGHDDESYEIYETFNKACFEAMRRIGEHTLPILDQYVMEDGVHELFNVFAHEAIFEVLDLDEDEKKKICKHREAIPHEKNGENFYTCAICEKVMTEKEWME